MTDAKDQILVISGDFQFLDSIEHRWAREYAIGTALSGADALRVVRSESRCAVVVADATIPDMHVAELLAQIRHVRPTIAQILLLENDDVKEMLAHPVLGTNVRIVIKPPKDALFAATLEAALKEYHQSLAHERSLEDTVRGATRSLVAILGLLQPFTLERAARVKRYVAGLSRLLLEPPPPPQQRDTTSIPGGRSNETWECVTAAILARIGSVAFPSSLIEKESRGGPLSTNERTVYQTHPAIGRHVIGLIPLLGGVADIVACQDRAFDAAEGYPDAQENEPIPLGARILKVAADYDDHVSRGSCPKDALEQMRDHGQRYDPKVLEALATLVGHSTQFEPMADLPRYTVHETSPRGENGIHSPDDSKPARTTPSRELIPIGDILCRPVVREMTTVT